MATVIQIKRSSGSAAPTTGQLAEGELAYSQDKTNDGAGAKLYIESLDSGNNPVIHIVGGKYYTNIIDSASSTNTSSTLVLRDGSGNFSAGTITATLAGSATSANIASFANVLTTARTISLGGDLSGSASFDGSQNITITAAIAADSVVLGTDTVGNYVGNVTSANGIIVYGTTGENWAPNVSLTTTGVTAGSYGNTTSIPAFTVDAFGRITNANVNAITVASTAFTTIAVAGQNSVVADTATDTVTLVSGGGMLITTNDSTDTVTLSANVTSVGGNVGAVTAQNLLDSIKAVDGTGSGLDADLLDGQEGSYYLDWTNTTNKPDPVVTVTLTGDVTGSAGATLVDLASNTVTIATTIAANSVTLGTDTTGGYVGNITAGTAISISDATPGGENQNITINNTGVTSLASGGHGITVSASTGAVTVTNNGVTAALGGTGIGVSAATGNVTFTNLGVTSIAGTTNQISVSSANAAVTLSLPASITTPGDLTISGNLVVNGNTTTVSTVDLSVTDPLIYLASNNYTSDSLDIGFIGHYYDATYGNVHTGLFRDASDAGKYKLFANVEHEIINTVDTTDPGYRTATLVAHITGANVFGLLTDIAVADGGTGVSSFTANSVLYGATTTSLGFATGTAGQVLQLNAGGVPVFGMLDGGTY